MILVQYKWRKNMKKERVSLNVCGDEIEVDFYHPIGDVKKVLLFCHGFPGTNRLPELASSLEHELVVEVNYRGDENCGGNFSFLGSIDDVTTTVDYIRNRYGQHMSVTALGYSMGGFYAANAMKNQPSLFNEVILLNPVVDTKTFSPNELLMEELWLYAGGILSLEKPLFYDEEIKLINESLNPMDFASELKIPISVVQSTDDEVLLPETAEDFYYLLNCKKRLFQIPNAKHDLEGNEEQLIQAIRGF